MYFDWAINHFLKTGKLEFLFAVRNKGFSVLERFINYSNIITI